MLVVHQRTARRGARGAAVAEALALLHDLEPSAPAGGPLAERGGVFWVQLPERHLAAAGARFGRLGYSTAVDLLAGQGQGPEVRWRGRGWRLVRLHTEDPADLRELAPDRREFLFEAAGGQGRAVRGYPRSGADPPRRPGPPPCGAPPPVNPVA